MQLEFKPTVQTRKYDPFFPICHSYSSFLTAFPLGILEDLYYDGYKLNNLLLQLLEIEERAVRANYSLVEKDHG